MGRTDEDEERCSSTLHHFYSYLNIFHCGTLSTYTLNDHDDITHTVSLSYANENRKPGDRILKTLTTVVSREVYL